MLLSILPHSKQLCMIFIPISQYDLFLKDDDEKYHDYTKTPSEETLLSVFANRNFCDKIKKIDFFCCLEPSNGF